MDHEIGRSWTAASDSSQRADSHMVSHYKECPATEPRNRSSIAQQFGGSQGWLGSQPEWMQPNGRLVRDMTNLEWAHIEAFDAAEFPVLRPERLAGEEPVSHLTLQPYITLLELEYPVDEILLAVREGQRGYTTSSGDGRRVAIKNTIPERVFLAVHRADFSVHHMRLEQEAYLLLSGIQDGLSLSDALDFAFVESSIAREIQASQIEQWFGTWMSLGWFCKSNTK